MSGASYRVKETRKMFNNTLWNQPTLAIFEAFWTYTGWYTFKIESGTLFSYYIQFLSKCADKIDWMQHQEWLHQMRMERAWRIFTCICVEYLSLPLYSQVAPFSNNERKWASKMVEDIMRVGNFGRGEYVFQYRGIADAWRNYRWVVKRCLCLGFVCPSEAKWWMVSKVSRFFWKRKIEKCMN